MATGADQLLLTVAQIEDEYGLSVRINA